jgi:hypothetical protein
MARVDRSGAQGGYSPRAGVITRSDQLGHSFQLVGHYTIDS